MTIDNLPQHYTYHVIQQNHLVTYKELQKAREISFQQDPFRI